MVSLWKIRRVEGAPNVVICSHPVAKPKDYDSNTRLNALGYCMC